MTDEQKEARRWADFGDGISIKNVRVLSELIDTLIDENEALTEMSKKHIMGENNALSEIAQYKIEISEARRKAFEDVLKVKTGPCYSSGLPCGCVEYAVKEAKE